MIHCIGNIVLETKNVESKQLFDIGNIICKLETYVSQHKFLKVNFQALCFQSRVIVSKLRIVFPIAFHCFQNTSLFLS